LFISNKNIGEKMKKIFIKIPSYTDDNGRWNPSVSVDAFTKIVNVIKEGVGDEYKVVAIPFDYMVTDDDGKFVKL
jgi:hypothetical protein